MSHLSKFDQVKFGQIKKQHFDSSIMNSKWLQIEKVLNTKFVKLIKIYNCYFGQLSIWESLNGSNLWFLNFDAYKLDFGTLNCLKLKCFEYQVCSSHQDIQLLFWSTFHLRKFGRFKFVIFKFRRLQTSFRNPKLSQIEKFWKPSLFSSSRYIIVVLVNFPFEKV